MGKKAALLKSALHLLKLTIRVKYRPIRKKIDSKIDFYYCIS